MRNFTSILIGLLVFSMSVGSQTFALFGPCTTDVEPSYENTISCSDGDCVGHILVTSIQRSCENEDDMPCEQDNNAIRTVTYDVVKTVDFTYDLLLDVGFDATCALCVLGVVSITGWTGAPSLVAISVACGVACRELFDLIDACLYTSCDPNLNDKHYTYGGHMCN